MATDLAAKKMQKPIAATSTATMKIRNQSGNGFLELNTGASNDSLNVNLTDGAGRRKV